jgi:hypothetical protein
MTKPSAIELAQLLRMTLRIDRGHFVGKVLSGFRDKLIPFVKALVVHSIVQIKPVHPSIKNELSNANNTNEPSTHCEHAEITKIIQRIVEYVCQ